jgi:hypothetical protein
MPHLNDGFPSQRFSSQQSVQIAIQFNDISHIFLNIMITGRARVSAGEVVRE